MRKLKMLAFLLFIKDHSNNPLIDGLYKKINNLGDHQLKEVCYHRLLEDLHQELQELQ
jgi:hypothetical protein